MAVAGTSEGAGVRYNAFSLIELLVVIAILVLLMAVLLPALHLARQQAKATLCRANLHEWGIIFSLYVDAHDGSFWSGDMRGDGRSQYCWLYPLMPYYGDERELCFCPMATRLRGEGAQDPFAAWGPMPETEADCSSYGMNNWVCDPPRDVTVIHGRELTEDNWRCAYVAGAARIPLFLDCAFIEGKPYALDVPPEYNGDVATWGVSAQQMKRFCLGRHSSATNGLFLDFSVRTVRLKELWTLKWHRRFDTAGPWTKAGGVQPSDWPKWMRALGGY